LSTPRRSASESCNRFQRRLALEFTIGVQARPYSWRFNAPNESIITGPNTTISVASPNDPVTAQNLPCDVNGNTS
jgi:hypothetical protein